MSAVNYSILVVDDDRAFRQTVCEIIQPHFELLEASSGEEAIEIVQHRPIHLALCDMHMEVMTGLETLKQVRELQAPAPSILMSADCTDELCAHAAALRVFQVLRKPFSRIELLSTLARALQAAYDDATLANRWLTSRPGPGFSAT